MRNPPHELVEERSKLCACSSLARRHDPENLHVQPIGDGGASGNTSMLRHLMKWLLVAQAPSWLCPRGYWCPASRVAAAAAQHTCMRVATGMRPSFPYPHRHRPLWPWHSAPGCLRCAPPSRATQLPAPPTLQDKNQGMKQLLPLALLMLCLLMLLLLVVLLSIRETNPPQLLRAPPQNVVMPHPKRRRQHQRQRQETTPLGPQCSCRTGWCSLWLLGAASSCTTPR